MNADKVISNLDEMLSSILEIEEFRSVLSGQETDSMKKMAIIAIERKIELLVKSWKNVKRYEPYISSDEILFFIKIYSRLNSRYIGKSSPELIISTIDTKLSKLKNEIMDLMSDYQDEN